MKYRDVPITRPSQKASMSSPRIRIRLLGPVSVEVDGSPLAVDTRKAVALLAHLAVTRRPSSREVVAALLWPGADGRDGRGALRRTLSVLKGGLGDPGLIVDRASVALDISAFEVDLWRFEEGLAVARGHAHPGDDLCPTCFAALQRALSFDRGEFMAGFALRDSEDFDEWQLAEAVSYRRDLEAVLERLARGQAAAQAWDAAASIARRWLELDPLHEPAHRLLMEVLARAGELAAALAQYRDCVRILDRELGVAPLTETTDLAEAIREGRLSGPPPGLAAVAVAAEDAIEPPSFAALPLVGRNAEIGALVEAHRAVGPDGRLLLIEGEAGIGKTRLVTSLADIVRSGGGTILGARAYRGEATIAFAPIIELVRVGLGRPDAVERLRTIRPELLGEAARLISLPVASVATASESPLDPYGQARIFEALADILVALAAGPVAGLVWLDDISWADASTIEFIGYLARRLRDRPVAIVVTSRSEELSAADREQVLGAPDREGLIRVELSRWDRADVAAVATAVLGDEIEPNRVDSLFERSEGLPLYVIESLAAPPTSGDPIPGGVTALLRARLDSVGGLAAQVLSAAAVIGRSFDLAIVRAASGRTDEETVDGLDEAIRRGLVREIAPQGGGDIHYDFTHGRLRDVAYERLSFARRRLLHARVAEALSGAGSGHASGIDRWSLIAHHETLAGRSVQAAEAHRRAGEYSRSVFANTEAREHLEAALALGSPAKVELHTALGEVLTLLGDYDNALGHLEAAAALAEQAERAVIEHRIGLILARRGDWVRADRRLVAALDLIGSERDPVLRSRILVDRSAIAQRARDPTRAEALAEESLALAEIAADPVAMARAEDLLGIVARSRGDLVSARGHLERAIADIDAADTAAAANASAALPGLQGAGAPAAPGAPIDPGVRIAVLNTLALVCADAGDHNRAIELTRTALILCERQGDRHRRAALENNLADLLQATGRPEEAMDHLKLAVTLFSEVGRRPGELEPEIWKLVEW
jgi:DNA-binding SARP family transcriptional activator/tetratricopeptide (TPR) repeat protein